MSETDFSTTIDVGQDDECFARFYATQKAFASVERILTSKGKRSEKTLIDSEVVFALPSLADVDTSDITCSAGAESGTSSAALGANNVFAHDFVSKLASYCEACESGCNGYGRNKPGAVTKALIASFARQQHAPQYYLKIIDTLLSNRSNHADFVALLRHRCIKLPLDAFACKLASNVTLFGNVLRYYINGFGSDEFCQSPKEQRKAEQVVQALLGCTSLSHDFDKSNGRLLLDAVLSPFTKAARHVICDRRVVWSGTSAAEIAALMKEFVVFHETRLLLLGLPNVAAQFDATEKTQIECCPAVERYHIARLPTAICDEE